MLYKLLRKLKISDPSRTKYYIIVFYPFQYLSRIFPYFEKHKQAHNPRKRGKNAPFVVFTFICKLLQALYTLSYFHIKYR